MKVRNSYNTATAITGYKTLPCGAYICEIKKAEEILGKNGNSDSLKISFDICEGEYKDFFADKYKADDREDKKWSGIVMVWLPKDDGSEKDGWTANRFKTIMTAIEESNKGYFFDWDEKKLTGKKFGAVFVEDEYNGKVFAKLIDKGICSVEAVKKGTYYTPTIKKNSSSAPVSDDFMKIDSDEPLPF